MVSRAIWTAQSCGATKFQMKLTFHYVQIFSIGDVNFRLRKSFMPQALSSSLAFAPFTRFLDLGGQTPFPMHVRQAKESVRKAFGVFQGSQNLVPAQVLNWSRVHPSSSLFWGCLLYFVVRHWPLGTNWCWKGGDSFLAQSAQSSDAIVWYTGHHPEIWGRCWRLSASLWMGMPVSGRRTLKVGVLCEFCEFCIWFSGEGYESRKFPTSKEWSENKYESGPGDDQLDTWRHKIKKPPKDSTSIFVRCTDEGDCICIARGSPDMCLSCKLERQRMESKLKVLESAWKLQRQMRGVPIGWFLLVRFTSLIHLKSFVWK